MLSNSSARITTRKGLISPTNSVSQPSNGKGSSVIPLAKSWILRTNRYFLSVMRCSASKLTGVESTRGTGDITSSRLSFPLIHVGTSGLRGPVDLLSAGCVDIHLSFTSLYQLGRKNFHHRPSLAGGDLEQPCRVSVRQATLNLSTVSGQAVARATRRASMSSSTLMSFNARVIWPEKYMA